MAAAIASARVTAPVTACASAVAAWAARAARHTNAPAAHRIDLVMERSPYFSSTRIENVPGRIGARPGRCPGCAGGTSPNSTPTR